MINVICCPDKLAMTITLATVATQFLDRPGLAQRTIESYEYALLPLLRQYGRWPIEIIDRETLEDYLNQLTHLAYTTHQRHQAILQALMNFAVDKQYIKINPIAGLKRCKPNPEKGEHSSDQVIRYLTPEQLTQLYRVVTKNYRAYTMVALLHRTGARISEILALDLSAIDLKNRKFQVLGKGNKRRWCFFSEDLDPLLEKYLKYYRHDDDECPALFTAQQPFTKIVSRLSYRMAHQDWRMLIKGIPELKDARLHDLRHTFATERVGLMNIEELRALMGHESIQTTLRYQKVTSARAEIVAQSALKTLTIESL